MDRQIEAERNVFRGPALKADENEKGWKNRNLIKLTLFYEVDGKKSGNKIDMSKNERVSNTMEYVS